MPLTTKHIGGFMRYLDGSVARGGRIEIRYVTSNGSINDTVNNVILSGVNRFTVQPDGAVDITLYTLPQTGLTPVGALYGAQYVPDAPGQQIIDLGQFDLTANTTIDALNHVTATPGPINLSQLNIATLQNLFPDPGFERGSCGFIGGVNSNLTSSQERVRSGQQAMKVTAVASPGAGGVTPNRNLSQFDVGASTTESEDPAAATGGLVDLLPNTVYTASGWVWNATGNSSGVSIRTNGAGVTADTTSTVVNTRNAWAQVVHTFTTSADPSTVPPKMFLNSANGGGQVTFWDDLGLVKGAGAVTGSGDDDGWAWDGRPLRSSSTYNPIISILPPYIHQAALNAAYADRNGALPSQSAINTVPGCEHSVTSVVETTIASTDPIPLAQIGGVLYGARNFTIYTSADAGRTWTLKKDLGTAGSLSGIQDIKSANDGELIVSRGIYGLWKSSGWATPSTSTWTQKITPTHVADDGTHGAVDGEIVPWGWDVFGAYVVATEYQGDGSYRPASRKVWLSTNNGSTFSEIYDLNTRADIDGVTSHLHLAMFDPYQVVSGVPRIFISHHGYNKDEFIKFSDNLGANWTTLLSHSPDAQPTVGIALPQAVVFGSDGKPDGLLRFSRIDTSGLLSSVPVRIWTWRSNAPGLSFICKIAQRVTDLGGNEYALISYRSRRNGIPGLVVMTDGVRADEVHRWFGSSSQQPLYTWAGVVNGEFVGRVTIPSASIDKMIRGTTPYYGPVEPAVSGGGGTAGIAYDTDGVPYLTT